MPVNLCLEFVVLSLYSITSSSVIFVSEHHKIMLQYIIKFRALSILLNVIVT
jgi:hypothetical protein